MKTGRDGLIRDRNFGFSNGRWIPSFIGDFRGYLGAASGGDARARLEDCVPTIAEFFEVKVLHNRLPTRKLLAGALPRGAILRENHLSTVSAAMFLADERARVDRLLWQHTGPLSYV